jgi:hypothetical protein
MRHRVLLAVLAAAFTVVASGPGVAQAQEQVAASCPGPPQPLGATPTTFTEFQTFAPTVSGALTRADLDIKKDPGEDGDWTVGIRSVDIFTGQPGATDLTSVTFPAASVPSGASTLTAVFPAPPQVAAGLPYALSFGSTGSYNVQGFATNTCPGIRWVFEKIGSTWTPDPQVDYAFKAYVTPPPAAPPAAPAPLAPVSTGELAAALKKCKKKKSTQARRKCKKKAKKLPV